jgi:hypothetical protein
MSRLFILISSLAFLVSFQIENQQEPQSIDQKSNVSIPVNGNSWYLGNSSGDVSPRANCASLGMDTLRTFFSIKQQCTISVAIVAMTEDEEVTIDAIFGNAKTSINVTSLSYDTIPLGMFTIDHPGYQHLDLVNTTREKEAQITHVIIEGDFEMSNINYVKDEFYWGKRGPSVHLTFSPEEKVDSIKWFYNEITVPEENDVIGSYFMAIGFAEGYFGIQVNSEEERRTLFSVWSPFQTDNPTDIPENQRIKMLKKGETVTAGKFGGEGSGGQSYMKYMWKAGITYKFLLKGEPTINNSTDYTAYFYNPEEEKWMLIASFRRPQTSTYLTRFHSFLENFIPSQGQFTRMGIYSNQWVCDKDGNWFEATKARFTADNTARKGARLDYAGGVVAGQFFMKNCGFFNETVTIGSEFTRPRGNNKPDIDFERLP